MAEATTQAPPMVNSFCWYELNTKRVDDVKKFYKTVFGWTTTESSASDFKYHHWHDKDGIMFGGIMDTNGAQWGDVPSHWMSYISVADIGASVEKLKALGGNVCVPPMTIPGAGTFSVVNDPTGVTFSLIQLEDPKPIAPVIVWNECATKDAAKASDFYAKLLGWTMDAMPMGEGKTYIICKNQGEGQGGIEQSSGDSDASAGMPLWLNFIGTKQVDADAKKVEKAGGTIVVPPMDIPGNIGRFCVFADPGGAHIAIYQSAQQ